MKAFLAYIIAVQYVIHIPACKNVSVVLELASGLDFGS